MESGVLAFWLKGGRVDHIRVKRMSDYTHMEVNLTREEEAHLSECEQCLNLLKFCLCAKTPQAMDHSDQNKSAA